MQSTLALLLSALFTLTKCFSMKVGRLQSVAVTGILECNGLPAENVKIMLYDKGVLSNAKLDEGSTEISGRFYLSGSKREITRIDPEISIYHNCNYNKRCYKKIRISIPRKFISSGNIPFYTFDIGKVNLAIGTSGAPYLDQNTRETTLIVSALLNEPEDLLFLTKKTCWIAPYPRKLAERQPDIVRRQ